MVARAPEAWQGLQAEPALLYDPETNGRKRDVSGRKYGGRYIALERTSERAGNHESVWLCWDTREHCLTKMSLAQLRRVSVRYLGIMAYNYQRSRSPTEEQLAIARAVLDRVCKRFAVRRSDVANKMCRRPLISDARACLVAVLRIKTGWSYSEIAGAIGLQFVNSASKLAARVRRSMRLQAMVDEMVV